jgi:hypothetical protein
LLIRQQRPGIYGINRLTLAAAILRHMTPPGLSKAASSLHTGIPSWAAQPLRMKVFLQPSLAEFVIADIKNWKVHADRVLP